MNLFDKSITRPKQNLINKKNKMRILNKFTLEKFKRHFHD
jgi:hypothetical protein